MTALVDKPGSILSVQEMETLFLYTYGEGMPVTTVALKIGATKEAIQNRLWDVARKIGSDSPEDLKGRVRQLGWINSYSYEEAQAIRYSLCFVAQVLRERLHHLPHLEKLYYLRRALQEDESVGLDPPGSYT